MSYPAVSALESESFAFVYSGMSLGSNRPDGHALNENRGLALSGSKGRLHEFLGKCSSQAGKIVMNVELDD